VDEEKDDDDGRGQAKKASRENLSPLLRPGKTKEGTSLI